MSDQFGRSVYGGLSLGGGWYLQWLGKQTLGHTTGVVLTNSNGSTVGVRWRRVWNAPRGPFLRLAPRRHR